MINPRVSLIITTKNEEKNIERLLESIKRQAYKNIETIVVDNFSTDETQKIAKKYTKKTYKIGPERSVQRNFGAKKASGQYLLFLDADMELSKNVVKSCITEISNKKFKALIVPEKTVGRGFIAKVRNFEREMYMGDPTIEVARFFDRKIFNKFGGYDPDLTGPEDYDLPYRISKKYLIGWSKAYIFHHEENLSLPSLLRKKYYYAQKGAKYAQKHPELVATQGTILFRKAYLKNWRKFLANPFLGCSFVGVRVLELSFAVLGYINSVGIIKFGKTLLKLLFK